LERQSEAKSMLAQLENYEAGKINQPDQSGFFHPEVIIPLVGAVILAMVVVVIAKRKRRQFFKKK
jgi:hypothetical protein